MTTNKMVTNKLQDQIKHQKKQQKKTNLATVNSIRQLPTEKKKIFILGDSMIENITGTGISRDHTVKIKPHPGATSIDMCDYIKSKLRHQPGVIILHCGTNDISNEINTLKKLDGQTHSSVGLDIINFMFRYIR